jgi:hypothetical protein
MIVRSPTVNENGGFPFAARMEQSVIRVSSFTHTVASATPHATFLDSVSLHPGYNLKPIFTPRIFKGEQAEMKIHTRDCIKNALIGRELLSNIGRICQELS